MLHPNLYPGVVRPIVSNIKANHTSTSFRSGSHSGRAGKFYPTVSSTIFDLASSAKNSLNSSRPSNSASGGPSYVIPSGSSGSSGSSPRKIDYYEAPITQKYGFGKETAYQEALANTAYRREMADMRKAGLNPSVIYGSHNSSGADSNIYPRSSGSSGSSGFSGGSSRGSSRGNSGKVALSGGLYYGAMAAVSAITAIATKNVGAGMMAGSIAGTALKALNGFLT